MEFADYRFTVSDVAALTDTNLNTIQSWRRKGCFTLEESGGWHRFTLPELFSIAVFAEVSSWSGNKNVASSASSFAVQMLTEILEDGAVPYFVGAQLKNEADHMELTYGAIEVGRAVEKLISEGADCGAYIVVDYSAISYRLFKRLNALGYDKIKAEGRD